ncbi:hypothetical protein [Streptomyces sp. NBC_01296]|uniref:hypothetical protein n=1 Tax=Streptomyces sp. NBC_01296 TaxID=2903816 RepID=UPI002E0D72A3|nr:hypothetical protein OG299_00515 [Streptomyces sp. NBC_01296]
MKNPLGDNGILTRAIPWTSILVVIILAEETITGDVSVTLKILAAVAALAVIARSIQQIVNQSK